MKTVKRNIPVVAVLLFPLFWIGCEDLGLKKKNSITVHSFEAIPENDTVPCKVNVISNKTTLGNIKYIFIHEGAFLDEYYHYQSDTTVGVSSTTMEITRTDTTRLFYNEAGEYKVTLIADGKTYSDEFTLYSPE